MTSVTASAAKAQGELCVQLLGFRQHFPASKSEVSMGWIFSLWVALMPSLIPLVCGAQIH
jgi:hypothetical protein